MDPDSIPYLSAFVDSVREVLRVMACAEVDQQRVCRPEQCRVPNEVAALMVLRGADDSKGFVSFRTDRVSAALLVGRILGLAPDQIGRNELAGAIGEVLNMIAGGARARLSGTPYHFQYTVPSADHGRRPGIWTTKATVIEITIDRGQFAVETMLQAEQNPGSGR